MIWVRRSSLDKQFGHAASVSWNNSILCIGGENETEHIADVWTVTWNGQTLEFSHFPPFPELVAFAS